MPGSPILELRDATVVKDDRRVLDSITLTIGAGEHTAIVGPNGAGKSVLVGLLTHQERPLARPDGPPPVRVFGADTWNIFDLRSQLGIVSAALHQHFVAGNSEGRITGHTAVVSVFLNSYGILRYGEVTREMHERAAEALRTVGAAHLSRRTMDQMSSGEARRVMLARVLAASPKALVLDEPTTGLDIAARHAFMERVRVIARAGTTIVLITHHIEEIVPEVGRVVLLREGRILADGDRRQVLTAPRLSQLFDAPVALEASGGYVYARLSGAGDHEREPLFVQE